MKSTLDDMQESNQIFLDFLEIKERGGESKLVFGVSLGYGVLLWWNVEGSPSNVLKE